MQPRVLSRAALCAAALVLVLAAVVVGALVQKATAQSVYTMAKTLCNQAQTTCNIGNGVVPGVPMTYKLTLSTSATGTPPVIVTDTLPAGFVVPSTGAVTCSPANTGGYQVVGGVLSIYGVPLSTGNTVCTVTGSFTVGANNSTVSNQAGYAATGSPNVPLATAPPWNSSLTTSGGYPNDLSIVKTPSTTTVNVSSGPQTVTYTIKVKNNGPADAYLGPMLRIEDRIRLRSNSVPLKVTYVSSTCSVPAPNDCVSTTPPAFPAGNPLTVVSTTPTGFVGWRYAPGSVGRLNAGDTMTITYVMKIQAIPGLDCFLIQGADGIVNDAHLALNLPATTTGGPFTALADPNPGNDTSPPSGPFGANELHVITGALVYDPACGYGIFPGTPAFRLVKTRQIPLNQTPGGFPWGSVITYTVQLQNVSGFPVKDIVFEDWVREGPGTPPFTADPLPLPAQPPCSPVAFCGVGVSTGPQNLLGYGAIKKVFQRTLFPGVAMANNQTFAFDVNVKYGNPKCDSYSTVGNKPVLNYPRITQWKQFVSNSWVTVNTIGQGFPQWSFMKAPSKCLFKVTKTSTGTKIHFTTGTSNPINYVVKYQSTDPQNSQTVGTVIDTVRLTTATYAASLNVDRAYSCTASGYVNFTQMASPNYPGPAPGPPLQVVNTTYAQQGVRVFQNQNPVTFGPLASLTCNVTLWVWPPAPTDPYCATNGALQNAAFLDESDYYDPNLDWPPSLADFFGEFTKRLPKCFDLTLNKIASPLWTWQGANNVNFQLLVSNSASADPIVPMPPSGPQITDTITPPHFLPGPNPNPVPTCTPGGCVSAWGAPAPVGVRGTTYLRINALPAGATQSETYNVQNTTANPFHAPGQICNEAYGTMRAPLGPQPLDFYWKHPDANNAAQTVHAKTCIPVLQTGKILVHKNVTVQPGFTAPSIPFTITTQCTNGSLVIPSSTATLTSGQSSLIQGIPVGSTCNTTEAALPPPTPVSGTTCQLAGWSPVVITPNPLTNTTSLTMNVTVTNHYGCLQVQNPTGTVVFKKSVSSDPGWTAPASATFTVTLACQGPSPFPTTSVNVLANTSAQITGVPVGSNCVTSEQTPPSAPGINANGTSCPSVGWFPPVITPNPLTNTINGTMTVSIRNEYGCLTPASGTITLKKVVTADPGYTAPPSATFPITVQCQSAPPQTVTLSATNFQTVLTGIPAGVTCVTTEVLPQPVAGAACNSIGWFPPTISPNPLGPTSNSAMLITVVNRYGCLSTPGNGLPTGTVTVKKMVVSIAPWNAPPTQIFSFGLQCGANPVVNGSVIGNGIATFANQPANASCTVTEYPPPAPIPTPVCAHLGWFPVSLSPNPVIVPLNGTVQVTATNRYGCLP